MKNWEKSICALARNFGGTCSSVEMLKGYMVRERLETPGLDSRAGVANRSIAIDRSIAEAQLVDRA